MTNPHYQLPIEETLKTAWHKVSGSKSTFWIAIIIVFFIMFALGAISALLPKQIGAIFNIAIQIVSYLLQMGLIYIGIKRAQDLPLSFGLMFRAFNGGIALKLIGLYFLQAIILFIPVLCCIIGLFLTATTSQSYNTLLAIILFSIGILSSFYLGIRLMLSMAFVIDTETGPVNAVRLSFQATQCNFWHLLLIMLIQSLIIIVSAIPLGIGLIWTLPFALINYGVIYKSLTTNNLSH